MLQHKISNEISGFSFQHSFHHHHHEYDRVCVPSALLLVRHEHIYICLFGIFPSNGMERYNQYGIKTNDQG